MANREDFGGSRPAPPPAGNPARPGEELRGAAAQGAQAVSDQAKDLTQQAKDVAGQAKEQVKDLASQAKEQTVEMAHQATDQVTQLVDQQKQQAAERLGGLAGALHEAAKKLDEKDTEGFGRYAHRAADQVERASRYLREKDLPSFVRDTEGFARRHPDLFLGGTLFAGVLLARFLKSSADRRDESWQAGQRADRGYGSAERFGSGYTGTQGRPYRSEVFPGTTGGL
ncbi:MAG TPA: YtxH domain-containing protein [Thermoanaerobaculia bacterium]|nr:YtxH domain-containing protein [Thermoanaerobaculia bacterium]